MRLAAAWRDQCSGPRVQVPKHTRVLGDDRQPVAPGQVGRLARWGHVPVGYYKDPINSAATFVTVDGVRYALPGDLARVESDGSVTMLGRGSNCINSGGEKIFPEEVEGALKADPGVLDVLVIGVEDDRLGHRVGALVQIKCETRSRATKSRAACGWSMLFNALQRASPTTDGHAITSIQSYRRRSVAPAQAP